MRLDDVPGRGAHGVGEGLVGEEPHGPLDLPAREQRTGVDVVLEQRVGDYHVAGSHTRAYPARGADHHDGIRALGEDRRGGGRRDLADSRQRQQHVVAGQPALQEPPAGHGVRGHLPGRPGCVEDGGQFGLEGGDDCDH